MHVTNYYTKLNCVKYLKLNVFLADENEIRTLQCIQPISHHFTLV